MRVVATGHKFALRQGEDWPGADFVTNVVAGLHFGLHDLGGSWCIEPAQRREAVPSNQNALHRQRVMTEDGKEDFDNAGLRVNQWRAVGISEERGFDQTAIQNAEAWDVTFFGLHMTANV